MFNGRATERLFRRFEDNRVDDFVTGNLRRQKCDACRKVSVGELDESIA